MTKIVYNACFGGFELSKEGVKRYGELAGLNLVWEQDERYKGSSFGTWFIDGDKEKYFSVYDFDRDDPILVQVVEELGDKANGSCAKLVIDELPKGTLYRIEEYDGYESVVTQDGYDWSVA